MPQHGPEEAPFPPRLATPPSNLFLLSLSFHKTQHQGPQEQLSPVTPATMAAASATMVGDLMLHLQTFPMNIQATGQRPLAWYSLPGTDLKELCQAICEDGLHAHWTKSVSQSLGNDNPLGPQD